MCGRYTFFTDKELSEIDDIIEKVSNDVQMEKMKTGEIYPTNIAPVLFPENNKISFKLMAWGFPNFRDKGVIINARSETIREKKLFQGPIRQKRCVIPSTGFYEWNQEKKKFLINVPDSGMLYMAGIYNQFEGADRFVILTTEANSSILEVHNRMPVVLPELRMNDWMLNDGAVDDILFSSHPDLIKRLADAS